MSSGKRFEKTFTRNRKKNDSTTKHDDVLPTTTTATKLPSSSSHQQQQQNGHSHNLNNNIINNNNGKSKVGKKPKQSTFNNNKNNKKTDSKTNKQNNENNNNKNNNNKSNDDENKDKKKSKKKKNASNLEKLKQRIQNEDDKDVETHNHKRKLENGVDEIQDDGVLIKEKKQHKTTKKDRKEETSSTDCVFPTNRILRIVKSEGSSDSKLSGEAIFLINKATEKFVELFSKDAYEFAREDQKSFVGYKHLASAVSKKKRFDFLADCVPEKVTAEKALAERKPAETLPV